MSVQPQAQETSSAPTDEQHERIGAIPTAPILSGRERVATLVLGFMVLGFAAYLIFDSRTDAALTALVVLAAILLVIGLIGHRLRSIKYRDTELQLVGGLLVDQAVRAQEEGRDERAEALAEAASALDPRYEDFARLRTGSDFERSVLDTLMFIPEKVVARLDARIGQTGVQLDAIFKTEGTTLGVEVLPRVTTQSLRRKLYRLAEALQQTPGLIDGLLLVGDDASRPSIDAMVSRFWSEAGVPANFVSWRPGDPREALQEAYEALQKEIEKLRDSAAD